MSEYTWPDELGIGYPEKQKKNCGSCKNGRVTNAGACIPGYACKVIEYIAKKRKIGNVNSQVNAQWGTCKFHNIPLRSIKDVESVLFDTAAQPQKGDSDESKR